MWSALFTFVVYMSVSFLSIYMYGSNINSDVLTNVSDSDSVISYILRIIFLVIAAMHVPFVFFVGKDALLIMVDEFMRGSISKSRETGVETLEISISKVLIARGSIPMKNASSILH
jgi:hypothetical protein